MIILGVDLGKVRTGLAVCDRGEMLASPAGVIAECSRERLADKISAVAKERLGCRETWMGAKEKALKTLVRWERFWLNAPAFL